MTGGAAGRVAVPPSWRHRRLLLLVAITVYAEFCAGLAGLGYVHAIQRPGTMVVAAPRVPRVAARPAIPEVRPAAIRAGEVRRLLDQRSGALRGRDRVGWLAGIDPRAAAFRARQAAVFDALAAVPLATWQYRLDPDLERSLDGRASRRYGAPVWVPGITLRYGLRGVDAEPTERPMLFTFVHRSGRWYLANDADTSSDGTRSWRGLWDFGRVVARRGRCSLVLTHPGHADRLATFVRAADDAVPAVTAVWGPGWRRQVALLLPDTQAEMAALVGEQFALARIAAVAIADYSDAGSGVARGQRVVLNPVNLPRLSPLGRQIVLRHEITHVASRAVTSETMPTWLIEGFADYVGYRGTGLSAGVVAPDLHALVRTRRWTGTLPADSDFRGDAPGLAVAYEAAWTACRLVAARSGTAGLVRFYRLVGAVHGTAAVDTGLRQVLHVRYPAFVVQWRAAVRAELG